MRYFLEKMFLQFYAEEEPSLYPLLSQPAYEAYRPGSIVIYTSVGVSACETGFNQ